MHDRRSSTPPQELRRLTLQEIFKMYGDWKFSLFERQSKEGVGLMRKWNPPSEDIEPCSSAKRFRRLIMGGMGNS
eukprot:2635603-Amphidinium_carterae.1